jgi:hypothetical protein
MLFVMESHAHFAASLCVPAQPPVGTSTSSATPNAMR